MPDTTLPTQDPDPGSPHPASIGPFRILQTLGEGGFGVVFLAEQTEPVKRRVALKLIKPGMDSAAVIARFEAEKQALAVMDHPCIAKVFDAGTTDRHLPYFVMEHVRGEPITAFCDTHRLPIQERIRLMIRVCDAVQHAHAKGVIHRDLNPSNVLVAYDAEGKPAPKVIDFGVAKALNTRLSHLTKSGTGRDSGGTSGLPRRGDAPEPQDAPTPNAAASGSPGIPSSDPTNVAHLRRTSLPHLRKRLSNDLDWVTMKCLEKDRARRYDTPSALAADLQRFLDDEPVLAGPPSPAYHLRKFVRRNRAPVTAALIAISVALTWALHQRALADRRADQLQTTAEFQSDMLSSLDPAALGATLTSLQHDELRTAITQSDAPDQGVESALATLDDLLAHTNPTNTAVGLLDQHILARAADTIDSELGAQPEVQASLRQTLAQTYADLGLYDKALPLLCASLETRRRLLGDLDPRTLSTLDAIGVTLVALGRAAESEPYFREALDARRRTLGQDHPDTIDSINNMGYALKRQGKLDESEPFYRDALERRQRILGNDDPATLSSMTNLGALLRIKGQSDEAERCYRRALDGSRRTLGNDHPDTLTIMGNLSTLFREEGRLDEAEPLLRDALEGRRRVLGDAHPATLTTMTGLGELRMLQGRLDEAEALFTQALHGQQRALGENHPETITTLVNLGWVQWERADLDAAEPIYRQVLQRRRRVLGDKHPHTLRVTEQLAEILEQMGRNHEAEALYRRALDGRREVLGPDHPDTITTTRFLARLLLDLERPDEAEPLAREAAERAAETSGPDDPLVGAVKVTLARALPMQRRIADAEPELLQARRIFASAPGEHYAATVKVTSYLVDLYTDWHEADPTAGHDTQAAEWRARLNTTTTDPDR